eukprot:9236325-Alexandrium_andersonii.AAC.1
MGKFEPRAIPGVDLGPLIRVGGQPRGSHYVASLRDLREFRLKARRLPFVHETKEVNPPLLGDPWSCPAK